MFGLNKHGFKRKTYDDILQDLFKKSRETFGENVNLSSRSILGMFIRIIAWTLSNIWQLAEKVYLSAYVRYAEGVQLDRIAGNIGIRRLGKTKSRGLIEVYVDQIPLELDEGFIVESVTGQKYISIQDEVIRKSGQSIEVISMNRGFETNAEIGEIKEIVTPKAEVDYVKNATPIVGGQDEETDDQFRDRYYKSLSMVGSSTRASIEATLRQIEGVEDALVIENDTTETVNGLPRQHLECIVLGGNDIDIGKAILETKAGGIGTVGDTVVKIDNYTVKYNKAKVEKVDVELTLQINEDYSTAYETLIKEILTKFINSLGIGETLYKSQIIMQLISVVGITNVEVKINNKNEDFKPDEYEALRLNNLVIKYA